MPGAIKVFFPGNFVLLGFEDKLQTRIRWRRWSSTSGEVPGTRESSSGLLCMHADLQGVSAMLCLCRADGLLM